MPKLEIQGFDGVFPRVSPTMLGQNQATTADNVKLYAGELRYWRGPTAEFTPANVPVSMYKVYRSGSSAWLTFATDTDVAPGPLADTNEIRLYYTSSAFALPRKTNWTLATGGTTPYPSAYLNMGVPAPTAAPTVTATTSAGATIAGDYVYVYTYVSTFGTIEEESGPSPASAVVTLTSGQGTTVGGFTSSPTTAAGYNITAMRIYRSISDSSGNVNYAYVTQISITPSTGVPASSSYLDILTATQLGNALPSLGWEPPPAALRGIVAMANGILAGFVGNTVYFCEPYYPHAWPSRYSLTVPHNIVGLGAFGNMLLVATEKFPYIIAGTTPDSMSQERLPLAEPCVSKRSIVSDEYGVTYASPNGLVAVGSGQRGLVTTKLFRRDEWQTVTPSTLIGAVYDNKYFGTFTSSSFTPNNQTMVMSRDDVPGLSFLNDSRLQIGALHVDQQYGYLYYYSTVDARIYRMDADDLNPTSYDWQSKRFVLPHGETFSAAKIDADYDTANSTAGYAAQVAAISAANSLIATSTWAAALGLAVVNKYTVNGGILTNFPAPTTIRTINMSVYGDNGALVANLAFTSFDPVRLPPFRARELQIQLTGNANVRGVALATTVPELRT